MKIDKHYLRQLIRESLEEGSKFTPATLPYEVGQEDAQDKEGLKKSVGAVSYESALGALAGCREMIYRGQKKLALENLYILEKYIIQ